MLLLVILAVISHYDGIFLNARILNGVTLLILICVTFDGDDASHGVSVLESSY